MSGFMRFFVYVTTQCALKASEGGWKRKVPKLQKGFVLHSSPRAYTVYIYLNAIERQKIVIFDFVISFSFNSQGKK